jgi:CYTH domain-containing protein
MNVEIERKFLVTNANEAIKNSIKVETISQCYISKDENTVVRVRNSDGIFYMTIKGKSNDHLSRPEFEFEIDATVAEALVKTLGRGKVEKTRYTVEYDNTEWVVDVFSSCDLVMTECECNSVEDVLKIAIPPWVGKEVTEDIRYSNVSIGFNGVPNEN